MHNETHKRKKIICIVGESCSGKDTLTRLAIEMYPLYYRGSSSRMKEVVSYTTRPMRKNETQGVEHIFISTEEAEKIKQNQTLLAYTKIKNPDFQGEGFEYFTTVNQLGEFNTYIIDPNGINSMNSLVYNGIVELCIIYIKTPKIIRFLRSKKRGDDKIAYYKRINNEKKQFELFHTMIKYNGYDNAHVIHNIFGFKHSKAKRICKIANKFL